MSDLYESDIHDTVVDLALVHFYKVFTSIVYKCAPFKNAMQNGSTPLFSGEMPSLPTKRNEAWTCQAQSPA